MRFKRLIAKSIALGLIPIGAIPALLLATPAEAMTKYYSRQVLSNLKTAQPAPSYTPAYGSYGSCNSSGTQSAAITTCTSSDGRTVDNSLCAPQTMQQSCTPIYSTCADLVQGHYSSTVGTNNIVAVSASSPAQAKSICEKAAPLNASYHTARCSWRQSENIVKVIAVSGTGHSDETTGYTEPGLPASNFWTAACTPNP